MSLLFERGAGMTDLPRIGSIIAVKMPCGQEALAEVLWYHYHDHEYHNGRRPSTINGLRIRWLPARDGYIRGYQLRWIPATRHEYTEGFVCSPPDQEYGMHDHRQWGEWHILSKVAI